MANSYRQAQKLGIPLPQELVDWWFELVREHDGDVIQPLYEWDLELPATLWNRSFDHEDGLAIIEVALVSRQGMRETAQLMGEEKYGCDPPAMRPRGSMCQR